MSVLRRYLSMPAGFFVRKYIHVITTSADEAIAAKAARHPVFELTPIR